MTYLGDEAKRREVRVVLVVQTSSIIEHFKRSSLAGARADGTIKAPTRARLASTSHTVAIVEETTIPHIYQPPVMARRTENSEHSPSNTAEHTLTRKEEEIGRSELPSPSSRLHNNFGFFEVTEACSGCS